MDISEEEIIKSCKTLKRTEKIDTILGQVVGGGVSSFVMTAILQLSSFMPEIGGYLMKSLSEPVGAVAGEITESIFKNNQIRKRNNFFDKVTSYSGVLTPETINKINSNQFILELAKTLDVIDRLAIDAKINFIANLFGKYFINECHEDVDFFEESLHHLNMLSFREIEVLITLYQLEEELDEKNRELGRQTDSEVMAKGSACTDQLIEIAPEKWGIDEGETIGILTSLCGSGFVREVVGAYVGYSGGVFYTTTYLKKFLSYIMDGDFY